jgi:hypothetical protein
LVAQIQENQTRQAAVASASKQYFKPHFGPEETPEMIKQALDKHKANLAWQSAALKD